jgi:hypothetical protein
MKLEHYSVAPSLLEEEVETLFRPHPDDVRAQRLYHTIQAVNMQYILLE